MLNETYACECDRTMKRINIAEWLGSLGLEE